MILRLPADLDQYNNMKQTDQIIHEIFGIKILETQSLPVCQIPLLNKGSLTLNARRFHSNEHKTHRQN